MNKTTMIITGLSLLILAATYGFVTFMLNDVEEKKKQQEASEKKAKEIAENGQNSQDSNDVDQQLRDLSEKFVVDIETERRLNASMVSQLRAYQDMLVQVENYAKRVEKDIDYIRAIAATEFKEDVQLQADLYTGKKPKKIAQQLEKFSPVRAGAILARMKAKEAGNVLDVWAKDPNPEVEVFYRDVMISYLKNRRMLDNPELFQQMGTSQSSAQNP